MKNILLVILFPLIVSCTSQKYSENIIGNWERKLTKSEFFFDDYVVTETISFNKNSTCLIKYDQKPPKGHSYIDWPDKFDGKYEIINNRIIMKLKGGPYAKDYDEEEYGGKIYYLDDTKLVIEYLDIPIKNYNELKHRTYIKSK